MSDLIDRQAAIDAMFEKMPGITFGDALNILRTLPSAQPEITLESAIDYLHSIGWMQEHDRALTESAQPEWKKGHYIGEADGYADGELVYDIWSCSECGCYFEDWDEQPTYNFCPNCGADMRTPTQVQLDEADDVMMGGKNGETD